MPALVTDSQADLPRHLRARVRRWAESMLAEPRSRRRRAVGRADRRRRDPRAQPRFPPSRSTDRRSRVRDARGNACPAMPVGDADFAARDARRRRGERRNGAPSGGSARPRARQRSARCSWRTGFFTSLDTITRRGEEASARDEGARRGVFAVRREPVGGGRPLAEALQRLRRSSASLTSRTQYQRICALFRRAHRAVDDARRSGR